MVATTPVMQPKSQLSSTEFHLAEAAGWRALLTEAQHTARRYLPPLVDDYVIRLLYRAVGQPNRHVGEDARAVLERMAREDALRQIDFATIGDQSLIFGGLFPEQAIAKGIPLAYFIHAGCNAYREYSTVARDASRRELFTALADHFVPAIDALHTLRGLQQNSPCIDALNAYQLWTETGSTYARHVLRQVTSALPSGAETRVRH